MNKKYYVYGLFDENGVIFYIGKGTDKRYKNHRKNYKMGKVTNYFLYCKIKSIFNNGFDFTEKIIINDLTEQEALKKELELINSYGKRIEGKGTLCNLLDGGTQPLNVEEIKKIYGEDFYKDMKDRQAKTMIKTTYKRNENKIKILEDQLNQGVMLKHIADNLNLTTNTLREWIKKYNLKMNYSGKQKRIKEHLNELREKNRKKTNSRSKYYTVCKPDGSLVEVRKLIIFCKENDIDYKNLRNTFNKFNKKGNQCKHKGFFISKQINPI
jgi:transposase